MISLLIFASLAFGSNDLLPENWGKFCPAGFAETAPKDFHTNLPLQFIAEKKAPLHRIVCEQFDAKTGSRKAIWNLYFCEDLNLNNYSDDSFYVSATPWFQFHPNYKRAEFLLFPKYTKWIRHRLPVNGAFEEVMTLHFMRNHQSEMEIIFQNSSKGQMGLLQKGSKSISANIFLNVKMRLSEDPVSCEIQ